MHIPAVGLQNPRCQPSPAYRAPHALGRAQNRHLCAPAQRGLLAHMPHDALTLCKYVDFKCFTWPPNFHGAHQGEWLLPPSQSDCPWFRSLLQRGENCTVCVHAPASFMRMFRAVKLLHMSLHWWRPVIIHLSTATEHSTPKVNCTQWTPVLLGQQL